MPRIEQLLDELVLVAVQSVRNVACAGLTLARDGHPTTVSSSDPEAARFDEVQYRLDDGPCLAAMKSSTVVHVDDLVTDLRFASYRLHVLPHGVRSSLSLPVRGGEHARGALNLYSFAPGSFGAFELARAQAFADEASRVLALAVRMARDAEINEQLKQALVSRAVIDHAIGIVMGQNRCTADAAFAILRSASQGRNVKLHVLATEMVTRVGGSPPGPGPAFRNSEEPPEPERAIDS